MEEVITSAFSRLTTTLPLKPRQQQLDPALAVLHRGILRSFVEQGHPLTREEMGGIMGGDGTGIDAALERLSQDDLIVLDGLQKQVVGAYPMKIEETPHQVEINGHTIHAMCALDAVSISPMFFRQTVINSRCHLSGMPIQIRQRGKQVLDIMPSPDVQVGIRWQSTCGCATYNLCVEMVFFNDRQTAKRWQGVDIENISIFTLVEAIEFGAQYFLPLLQEDGAARRPQRKKFCSQQIDQALVR